MLKLSLFICFSLFVLSLCSLCRRFAKTNQKRKEKLQLRSLQKKTGILVLCRPAFVKKAVYFLEAEAWAPPGGRRTSLHVHLEWRKQLWSHEGCFWSILSITADTRLLDGWWEYKGAAVPGQLLLVFSWIFFWRLQNCFFFSSN